MVDLDKGLGARDTRMPGADVVVAVVAVMAVMDAALFVRGSGGVAAGD